MEKEVLIPAQEFCNSHDLEISFIYDLEQYGLLQITTIEQVIYLQPDELEKAEKIARMRYDLGINMEGIDAITNLLDRVEEMQQEINLLRNRLRLYEND